MSIVLFLEKTLQTLGIEAAGIACLTLVLFGIVKMSERHSNKKTSI